jgi:hypothetical protein
MTSAEHWPSHRTGLPPPEASPDNHAYHCPTAPTCLHSEVSALFTKKKSEPWQLSRSWLNFRSPTAPCVLCNQVQCLLRFDAKSEALRVTCTRSAAHKLVLNNDPLKLCICESVLRCSVTIMGCAIKTVSTFNKPPFRHLLGELNSHGCQSSLRHSRSSPRNNAANS